MYVEKYSNKRQYGLRIMTIAVLASEDIVRSCKVVTVLGYVEA